MANEAEIINNPDSTPGAVSTGYQLQNTNLVSQRTGVDKTYVSGGVGTVTVEISGPVDVNGVMYDIKSQTILTPPSAGRYYITLQGAGPQYLTPTLGTSAGTFDPLKNARYDGSGYRVLNWVVYFDGTDCYASRLPVPDRTDNLLLHTDGPFEDIGEPEETHIAVSGTTWTAKRSKYYKILLIGTHGERNLHKRIWIDVGDTWTFFYSVSGGTYTTSFSDGVTTLSAQLSTGNWTVSGQDYLTSGIKDYSAPPSIGVVIIKG